MFCFNIRTVRLSCCLLATALAPALPASADQQLENGVAVFSALDKVTARIKQLKVPINETVKFGALKVTPRVCYSRPATERPKTTTFVEVDEIQLDGNEYRIFSGWMFAESPGLNAVEHPVFDVGLTRCEDPKGAVSAQRRPGPDGAAGEDGDVRDVAPAPRRRVRR